MGIASETGKSLCRRLAVIVATAATLTFASASPASADPIDIGHIPECTELVPAAVSVDNTPVNLEARFLLDGVTMARGQEVAATAKDSYAPLGITLNPSFEAVNFSGADADSLIDQAKAHFGGARPAGVDVVYTLTSEDLEIDGDTSVAGLADCIGGVAFPDRAFAVGEDFGGDDDIPLGVGGVFINRQLTAKVAAHEIGHLMGGHHHYANCVEGLLSEFPGELSACTLMFNAVDLASLNFSTLNGVVVKGHAQLYALP